MTIHETLVRVMQDVQAVRKGELNKHGGYAFRGIDAVVNAVGPALRAHGVIVAPKVERFEYGEIFTGKDRRPMGHARVVVAYTFYAQDGSSLECSAAGEAFDSGDKATPKAMSVAFRTALLQALCLPTDEPDPDAHTYQRAPSPRDVVLAHHNGDFDAAMQGAIEHGLTLPDDLEAYSRVIQGGDK